MIDLGLVKADRALRTADSPSTTEVGRLLCTPGYASPEQAAGLPLDRRSDIYSMAVTLYRVLAGRLPFHEARGKAPMVVESVEDSALRTRHVGGHLEVERIGVAVRALAHAFSPPPITRLPSDRYSCGGTPR